jgi:hypothetical protein
VGCDAANCLVDVGGRLAQRTRFGFTQLASTAVLPGTNGGVGCTEGGVCLVVETTPDGALEGLRVNDVGAPIDAAPFSVFATGSPPRVVGDGTDLVVASQNDGRIGARRVDAATGTLSAPIDLIPEIDSLSPPAVACGPDACLAVGTDLLWSRDIVAARFQGTQLIDDPPIVLTRGTNRQWLPSAASDGTSYLVSWTDVRDGTTIRAARMAADDLWIDGASIAVGNAGGFDVRSTTAWTGTAWLVAWGDAAGLHVARVNPSGTVLDVPPVDFPGPASQPSVGCDDSACVLAYQGGGDEQAFVIGADGAPFAIVDLGPASTDGAAITWIDGAFAIAWARGDGHPVAARLGPDGTLLDATPVDLVGDDPFQVFGSPSMAVLADSLIVAWGGGIDTSLIEVVQLDGSLRLLSPVGTVAYLVNPAAPHVIALDDTALVAWSQSDFRTGRLAARQISGQGVPLGSIETLADAPADATIALVAGPAGEAILVDAELDATLDATRLRVFPIGP